MFPTEPFVLCYKIWPNQKYCEMPFRGIENNVTHHCTCVVGSSLCKKVKGNKSQDSTIGPTSARYLCTCLNLNRWAVPSKQKVVGLFTCLNVGTCLSTLLKQNFSYKQLLNTVCIIKVVIWGFNPSWAQVKIWSTTLKSSSCSWSHLGQLRAAWGLL